MRKGVNSLNISCKEFFNSLKNKKVTFIGLGVSHRELIKKFMECGAEITVCDKRNFEELGEIGEKLKKQGVKFNLGENYLDNLSGDIIMRTPGLNYYNKNLTEARKNGSVITSETELFFDLCPAHVIAITGSDGKTTTATITAEFLKNEGYNVHLGGNIGKPLLYRMDEIRPEDYVVIELSSFQLMSMRRSADTVLITNISPNHLDMHNSMEEYIESKYNLIYHQNAFGTAVLNADNKLSSDAEKFARGNVLYFSVKNIVENGTYLKDNQIILADHGKEEAVLDIDKIKIPGMHNVENYMAAICLTKGLISKETILKVAETFSGVEHRFEFVREINGVRYYNDTMATTPTSAIAGISSSKNKMIMIAGGHDKKLPFDELAEKICEKVKVLILMGETSEKIENAVKKAKAFDCCGIVIEHSDNMEESVEIAKKYAVNGDMVALCPACSSFDKYKNFAERGNHFKKVVNSL